MLFAFRVPVFASIISVDVQFLILNLSRDLNLGKAQHMVKMEVDKKHK